MTDIREKIDQSALPPNARVVLDYLARQPARLFRFDELAEALSLKRADVEQALVDLRHPRNGAPLANADASGKEMRKRWAWLPPDSPVRDAYPPLAHPDPPDQPEHNSTEGGNRVEAARRVHQEEQEVRWTAERAERKALRRAADAARLKLAQDRREARIAARQVFRAASAVVPPPSTAIVKPPPRTADEVIGAALDVTPKAPKPTKAAPSKEVDRG